MVGNWKRKIYPIFREKAIIGSNLQGIVFWKPTKQKSHFVRRLFKNEKFSQNHRLKPPP